jgi:hypothetical protein
LLTFELSASRWFAYLTMAGACREAVPEKDKEARPPADENHTRFPVKGTGDVSMYEPRTRRSSHADDHRL